MSGFTPQPVLELADQGTVADLRTFVSRARAADDGATRLVAAGTVLAAYVCVMRPKLLGEGTPTILGLRTMALAVPADLDATVPLAAVSDRLARMSDDDVRLAVPPTTLHESWAGISAPRGGWERVTEIDPEELIRIAGDGAREVAQIIPANPGAMIVNNARAAVWGRLIPGMVQALPAGAAFAAHVLGFLTPGDTAVLFRSARWLRLSTGRGHVLIRPGAEA
ncbi:hypothetical protein IV500_16230 [Paeniglutamicibacter antarcticus]|uniref:Uncharacterized protein n=1 Tax=Arthrobacter terrae TaxID=2935737 RepID=A0A931G981_9MICC|nr:hypothetical protein [Arthrobacter terrae]MBG0740924.1 hypothetical protein [Arthrobacter terrae]